MESVSLKGCLLKRNTTFGPNVKEWALEKVLMDAREMDNLMSSALENMEILSLKAVFPTETAPLSS